MLELLKNPPTKMTAAVATVNLRIIASLLLLALHQLERPDFGSRIGQTQLTGSDAARGAAALSMSRPIDQQASRGPSLGRGKIESLFPDSC